MISKNSSRSITSLGSRKNLNANASSASLLSIDRDMEGKGNQLKTKTYISSLLDVFRTVINEPILATNSSSKNEEYDMKGEEKDKTLDENEKGEETQTEDYNMSEGATQGKGPYSAYLYNDYTGETIYIDMDTAKEIASIESQLSMIFDELGIQEDGSIDLSFSSNNNKNAQSKKNDKSNLLIKLLEKKMDLLNRCKMNRKFSYWRILYSEDGTEFVDPYQFLNLFYVGVHMGVYSNINEANKTKDNMEKSYKRSIISNYLENFGIEVPTTYFYGEKEAVKIKQRNNSTKPKSENLAATIITNFIRLVIARNQALYKVCETYGKYMDPSTGFFYYYNFVTGEIQYHKPVVLGLFFDIGVTWQEQEGNDIDNNRKLIEESKVVDEIEEEKSIEYETNHISSETEDFVERESKENDDEEEIPDPNFYRKKSLVIPKTISLIDQLQQWREKHLQVGPFYERSGHFRERRRVRQNFFLVPKKFEGRHIVKKLEDVIENEIQVPQHSKEKGKKLKDYSEDEKKALQKTTLILENGDVREEVEVDGYLLTRSIARKQGALGLLRLFRKYHTKKVRLEIYTTLAQYDYPPNEDGSASSVTLDLLQTCLAEMSPPLDEYLITVLSALQALLGHYCNRGLFLRLNGLLSLIKLIRMIKEETVTIQVGSKEQTINHLPEERIIIGEYLLRIIGLLAQDEGNRLLVCEMTVQDVIKCMKELKDHQAPLIAGYICFYNFVFLNEECHKLIQELHLKKQLEKLVTTFDTDKSFMTMVNRTFTALGEDGWRAGFG